ncbi:MAG: hypothetical protein KDD55_05395 [Bdellovibrionales bacterium]|nr:hypothetical protein [Bdellovibrionales bacterium]
MVPTGQEPAPEEAEDPEGLGQCRSRCPQPSETCSLHDLKPPTVAFDPREAFARLLSRECSGLDDAVVDELWSRYSSDLDGCVKGLLGFKQGGLPVETKEEIFSATSALLCRAISGQMSDNLLFQVQTSRLLEMIAQESKLSGVQDFIHSVFEEYELLFDYDLYRLSAQEYQARVASDGTHNLLGYIAATTSEGIQYLDEILTINSISGFTISTHAVSRDPDSPTGWRPSFCPMTTEGYEQEVSFHSGKGGVSRRVIVTGKTNSLSEFLENRAKVVQQHGEAVQSTLRRAG